MTFTCHAADLKAALGLLNGATRDLVLAQNSVILSLEGSTLTLEGVSHGGMATTHIAVVPNGDGFTEAISLDHTRLSGLAGAMVGDIEVSVAQKKVKLSAQGQSATLNGIVEIYATEYPATKRLFGVGSDDLKAAVARVDHCVGDPKSGLPQFRGVSFKQWEGQMIVCATNGFASAQTPIMRSIWHDMEFTQDRQVFVPLGSLKDAVKAVGSSGNTEVWVEYSESMLAFITDAVRWYVRRIEGGIPDLMQYRPTHADLTTVLSVDKDALKEAIKLAGLFASKSSELQDVIRLTVEGTNLTVRATGSEHGSYEQVIPVIEHMGEDITLKLAGPLLRNAVDALPGDTSILSFVAPNRPIMVTYDEEQPDHDFQLIVPCV
jgi:DNA polymerase III sliding clamp (beta) subunit (PCNA family)